MRACPLRDDERTKTPFSVTGQKSGDFCFISGPSLLSAMRSLIKPLHWAHVNCIEQLLPVENIPGFPLVGKKKCLVWENWSKTLCLHCRGAWAMTKKKLFHVCCFCKVVSVGVEKSMQSHVGFMMMLISCVLWLTFLLSTLHPVILAYYCFCSCTMVVIESLSIAVSHN